MKSYRGISVVCAGIVLLTSLIGCASETPDNSMPFSEVSSVVSQSSDVTATETEAVAASSKKTGNRKATGTSSATKTSTITKSSPSKSKTAVSKKTTSTNAPSSAAGKTWYSANEYRITKSELAAIVGQNYRKPKNVIVMIGDGMGANDIAIAEQFAGGTYDFGLVLNQIPYHGLVTTKSANAEVTDSAASGTALATGYKTNNGYLGKAPDGTDLKNIVEIARENGKRIGLVTNDNATGATPCAFSVHNAARTNTAALANSLVELAPDVLIAQGFSEFRTQLTDQNLDHLLEDINNVASFNAFTRALDSDPQMKRPFFGFITDNMAFPSLDLLANCTQMALNRLENDRGFFLMVENAATDKAGHNKSISGKLRGVVALDRSVAVVLKFMKTHPDTLLIITSDHETGGVQLPAEGARPSDNLFTTGNHTSTAVRLFAVGYAADQLSNKTVDNTDVAQFAIRAVQGKL